MARVLLVDDDDLVRATTKRMLERLGHEVVSCGGPQRAREAYSHGFDIVIADMRMPGQDGLALVRELGARRVIISSGLSEPPDAFSTLDIPCFYLGKPYSHRELASAIDGLMEMPDV